MKLFFPIRKNCNITYFANKLFNSIYICLR